MPFITLASPTDTVVLMGDDPYATGYTYRNDTLTSWYKFAGADAPKDKRPNAHGSFGYDRLYANEGGITIKGSFFGSSAQEAALARNRLTGLFADGLPVTMTVSDELGVSSRRINVVEADVPWLPYPNFDFELNATVPDPRRYGPSITQTTGAPTPGSGLVWPLGSSIKGQVGTSYFWNGTPNASTSSMAVDGVVQRTNDILNPAFSIDASNWSTVVAGDTLSTGTQRGKVTSGSTHGSGATLVQSSPMLGNPGQVKSASAVVTNGAPAQRQFRLQITAFSDAAGSTFLGSTSTSNVIFASGAILTIKAENFTLPAGTVTYRVSIITSGDVVVTNDIVYFDNVISETAPAVGAYFDGATPGNATPGLYWDWGTVGASGQLTFTNAGNASTSPSFRAYGAAFAAGFRITEVETGRELTYGLPTVATDSVYLNGRYRTVSLNGGGNYTQRLIKRQWFTVPPRTTRTYQFTPLGGYTGTPYLDLIAARADL